MSKIEEAAPPPREQAGGSMGSDAVPPGAGGGGSAAAQTQPGDDKSKPSSRPTSREREANRKRNLMLKFRDSLRGPVLEKMYSAQIVGPSTTYDVEKWVRRIFQMDPLGALKQMRDLGAVQTSGGEIMHVDAQKQKEGTRRKNTANLKAKPFTPDERKSIDTHIAARVKTLVAKVNTEFAHENKYLKRLREDAGLDSPEDEEAKLSPKRGVIEEDESPAAIAQKQEILRHIEVVELRLANLKRQVLKKKLEEEILLFIQEAEQLVYDQRFEDEKKRADRADAQWGALFANMKSGKTKKVDDAEAAGGRRFDRKIELKKNNVQPLPVQTMSTVYDYIHARYVLEGSRSSLKKAKAERERQALLKSRKMDGRRTASAGAF
ncbi:unnamed protein product [Amoebophrya sp. A120]|nr:unnamed protein product [Amoebophrya sp. A120]|eukprot:GSA120T00017207001.1